MSHPNGVPIHLQVPAGAPLRLYLSGRIWFQEGAPVTAKLIEPLWAFDRTVVPAGTTVRGQISSLHGVSRATRAAALLNGDFTPLKEAQVVFTSLEFSNGRSIAIATRPSLGLATLYAPKPKRAKGNPNEQQQANANSVRGNVQREVQAQIKTESDSVIYFVRRQNKKEWVAEFLLGKLPYHPQWYRAGTRFDAELTQSLDFGTAMSSAGGMDAPDALLTADAVAQVRLLETITSAEARVGQPVNGLVSRPVYSSDQKLILPEGTKVSGKVTFWQRARYFPERRQNPFCLRSH